jgi:outer membrane lipoprotein-sorting protein
MNVEPSAKTLWVDRARFLVLRDDSATKMTLPNTNTPTQSKQTITFNKIKIDEPIPDDLFEFTPPEGATELDLKQFLPNASGPHNSR